MFAKLQKHKERKSKQQLKFRFDVYDIECINLPQNVFSVRVLLTRGAKVSLTSESFVDANTNSASFWSTSEETEENTNNISEGSIYELQVDKNIDTIKLDQTLTS